MARHDNVARKTTYDKAREKKTPDELKESALVIQRRLLVVQRRLTRERPDQSVMVIQRRLLMIQRWLARERPAPAARPHPGYQATDP